MDERDSLCSQLNNTFTVELHERLALLDRDLQALAALPVAASALPQLDTLYRTAYHLQGAARAVDSRDIARLAGGLSSAFSQASAQTISRDARWFDTLRRALNFFPTIIAAGQPADYSAALFDLLADLEPDRPMPATPPAFPTLPDLDPPAAPAPAVGVTAMPPATPSVVTTADVVSADTAPLPTARPASAGESVRVKVDKLDALFDDTGELAVVRGRVQQRLREVRGLRDQYAITRRDLRTIQRKRTGLRQQLMTLPNPTVILREFDQLGRIAASTEQQLAEFGAQITILTNRLRDDLSQLEMVSGALADGVLAVRLLPVSTAFGPFERLVRDLAREHGKQISLHLEDRPIEIDRNILDRLRDPLMHMLRNAIDHGIERPEIRIAAGKGPTGTVSLTVVPRGGVVEFTLADDGVGLDPGKLRQAAVQKGLLTAAQADTLDDDAARALIFHPGFSTSDTITATSGRGVGMDVVREEVIRLGGRVQIASDVGRGTVFTAIVPLTLATTKAIVGEVGGQKFALPLIAVERMGRIRRTQFVYVEGRQTITLEGRPLPAIALETILGLPPAPVVDPQQWRPYLIVRQEEQRCALLVDHLFDEQELVVKPLGWPLRRVRNLSGVAVLGSGEIITLLNPTDLLQSVDNPARLSRLSTIPAVTDEITLPAAAHNQRVLVVDDSLMTRTLERSILEAAGYSTVVATDGVEALALLEREPIDLVVSDVEMPRMDGFGLTTAIRRNERLRQIPVILMTSLDAPEHRERGVIAGADAYLTKGSFDQGELLETIGRLL